MDKMRNAKFKIGQVVKHRQAHSKNNHIVSLFLQSTCGLCYTTSYI
jgi:predicted nucleotide-binding protein (sugar kinase/HSP70/actin superfamily)